MLTEEEKNRQSDAWLPSEATRRCLLGAGSKGVVIDQQTLPCLVGVEIGHGSNLVSGVSGDPMRALLTHCYHSEVKADNMRCVITADVVTQDTEGLSQLITGSWFRAALDLTHRLLTSCGHGRDKTGQPSATLTSYSAQLWLVRFSLLKLTHQYDLMERELEAFGTLDNPDVYFEYSPNLYPTKKGSIIPFSLRLLHAELPRFLNRPSEALDRLYFLAAVVDRIISNLENGYTEDAAASSPSEEYQKCSLVLWRHRACRVHSNCLAIYLTLTDYPSAIDTAYQMMRLLEPLGEHRFLFGILGKIYLKFGDLESAERFFAEALVAADPNSLDTQTQKAMFDATLLIGRGRFEEAKKRYREALELNPANVTAANNLAVCALFVGQLDEGVSILETLTTPAPGGGSLPMHDALIANLAVLYEIDSDKSVHRKLRLLERLAAPLTGDRVNIASFKLA